MGLQDPPDPPRLLCSPARLLGGVAPGPNRPTSTRHAEASRQPLSQSGRPPGPAASWSPWAGPCPAPTVLLRPHGPPEPSDDAAATALASAARAWGPRAFWRRPRWRQGGAGRAEARRRARGGGTAACDQPRQSHGATAAAPGGGRRAEPARAEGRGTRRDTAPVSPPFPRSPEGACACAGLTTPAEASGLQSRPVPAKDEWLLWSEPVLSCKTGQGSELPVRFEFQVNSESFPL